MIPQLNATLTRYSQLFPNLAAVLSGGPTGLVIGDRLVRLGLPVTFLTIDTGVLFPETYTQIEQLQAHWGVKFQVVKADSPTDGLWQTDTGLCCMQRKVIPLRAALHGFTAWYTGLRRDQGSTRDNQAMVSWDSQNGLIKLAPLAMATRAEVWAYLKEWEVPYNPLHDQGYASIGCTHCTKATRAGASERDGRWQGTVKTECGIHFDLSGKMVKVLA